MHEFGHLIVARLFGIRVLIFSVGFGKRLVGFRFGETDYRISLIPLGGYVKMSGETLSDNSKISENEEDESHKFINKPRWQRILVIFAGPAMNGVLAIAILSAVLMVSGIERATQFVIDEVVQNSPASISGLEVGDELRAIDNYPIENDQEYLEAFQYVRDNSGNPLSFEVLRGNKLVNIVIIPENQDGQGKIGVLFDYGFKKERLGPIDSISRSTSLSASLVKQTFQVVGKIITGESSAEENLAGPVGIASMSGDAVKQGPVTLLLLIASISIAIGLANLVLPIPIMDSGRLYILFIEMLLRKDFSVKVQNRLAGIGLAMFFVLFSIAMYIDISRITSS